MKKILQFSLAILFSSVLCAQNKGGIKGITTTGIKGVTRNLKAVIAYDKAHPIPLNYKVHLKPEIDGPEPIGQDPNAKSVSKTGALVDAGTSGTTTTTTSISSPTSNFLAIWGSYAAVANRESPYTPPDNCGDVGPTQIIATANCRMKVFAKPSLGTGASTPTGSSISTLPELLNFDLNTFFAYPTYGISGISDPHVRYDRFSGRWFIVAIDINHRTNNYACVAVSKGPEITQNSDFTIYYFNVSGTGGSSRDFFDYPTLGIDKFSLYIGGNMFASQKTYSGSTMWVVDKASLLSGSMTVTSFPNNKSGTDMYTPQGVHNDDPDATEGYFIGASQTLYSKLVIRRVLYDAGGTPRLSGDLTLSPVTTYSPKTVPTLGGTAIDGNDRRICAAMIKKNKITGAANLWIAQGTLLNSSGIGGSSGDRDGALWLEIENLSTSPSSRQAATLYDGVHSSSSAAENYIYPTIATNGQGHSLMGFTSAGASKYAQAAAAQRFRTDAPETFHPAVDFTTTTSTYNPGANRWGDYTQTVVDPTDDMTMWTFTEYVPTTNAWGVRAAQFLAPPPATPVLATTPVCGTTTTVTINGTSTSNSEFFDPGPDYSKHLNVSVSGASPITVSNISFVSPIQIKADFAVPAGASSGDYTLTVTNPDGQSSSTTFTLSCSATSCGDPSGLSATDILTSSATLSWNGSTGANYDLDDSTSGGKWTSVSRNQPSTSFNVTGLNASTTYYWRVRANCSSGSSNYAIAQFTTATATTACDAPTSLTASNITGSGATVSWTAANGAISYDVDYSISGANTWVNVATSTISTSANITGLNSSQSYDWRVRTNCSSGSSSYATSQFSTTCDGYEPNNTLATATPIGTGTITAQIATLGDVDYYSFSTAGNQKNLQVTLTNLPADYDLTLYDNNGKQLTNSANSGTADETVVNNSKKPGTYIVKVAGHSGTEFSATSCYLLTVNISSGTFTAVAPNSTFSRNLITTDKNALNPGLKVYPIPASNTVTVSFDAIATTSASITFINELGQQVMTKKVQAHPGTNINTLDVSGLEQGIYTIKVNNGTDIQTTKLVISK